MNCQIHFSVVTFCMIIFFTKYLTTNIEDRKYRENNQNEYKS